MQLLIKALPKRRYKVVRHLQALRGGFAYGAAAQQPHLTIVSNDAGCRVEPVRSSLVIERILKEVMDRVGAAVALLLLSPLVIFLAWKIRQDGGPAFYGFPRVGKDGRLFKCWKFRSMVVNSQAVLSELLANDPAARAEYESHRKLKCDPRVTRIGNFMRKTSLDEVPQLFNVLRGEMSLVGPRPILEDEKKYYAGKASLYALYASVKPGISGLWQVSGRADTTFDQRLELDSHYVRNWSLWNDIIIAFKTVHVVLARKGAY